MWCIINTLRLGTFVVCLLIITSPCLFVFHPCYRFCALFALVLLNKQRRLTRSATAILQYGTLWVSEQCVTTSNPSYEKWKSQSVVAFITISTKAPPRILLPSHSQWLGSALPSDVHRMTTLPAGIMMQTHHKWCDSMHLGCFGGLVLDIGHSMAI